MFRHEEIPRPADNARVAGVGSNRQHGRTGGYFSGRGADVGFWGRKKERKKRDGRWGIPIDAGTAARLDLGAGTLGG